MRKLATVNAELRSKVEDLSRANNDMNNLLAGTGIATIFVDHQLHILRFTPATSQIINLIPSDVGRPVGHIVSNLVGYDRLVEDVQGVLDTLTPLEAQVQTSGGLWYVMRIRPYRTLDNVIEGAVITFVDITEMKRVKPCWRAATALFRLGVVVRDAFDAITVQDLDGRILAWNPGAERIYGWSEAEALLMNARPDPAGFAGRSPGHGAAAWPGRNAHTASDATPHQERRRVHVWLTASALVGEAGRRTRSPPRNDRTKR
jgi:two-component system CheB/CheR fusion protein